MSTMLRTFQNRLLFRPWVSFFIVTGIGLALNRLLKRNSNQNLDVDRQLSDLLAEEEAKKRFFPKEVDLAPAFE
jgi:hypothetical protein